MRQDESGAERLADGNNAVRQTDAECLGGPHRPTGEDEVERASLADESRQPSPRACERTADGGLRAGWGSITQVGAVVMPYSVSNQEQGTPILVCTDLREPLDDAWAALKHFA
jgi:hypothetical protein